MTPRLCISLLTSKLPKTLGAGEIVRTKQILVIDNAEEKLWFAMGAPYRNEIKVQKKLEELGARSFIPMKTDVVERQGRRLRVRVPAVSNLIFVNVSRDRMSEIKPMVPQMQYKIIRSSSGNSVITVPDKEMEDFIAVTEAMDGGVVYYAPDEVSLAKGTRVRIIGGMFDGAEGVLLKMKGHRSRRFVVSLPNLLCAATEVSPDLIEILGD